MEIKDDIAINISAVMLVQGNTFWGVILTPFTRDDDADAHARQTRINMPDKIAGFDGNEIPMPKW